MYFIKVLFIILCKDKNSSLDSDDSENAVIFYGVIGNRDKGGKV